MHKNTLILNKSFWSHLFPTLHRTSLTQDLAFEALWNALYAPWTMTLLVFQLHSTDNTTLSNWFIVLCITALTTRGHHRAFVFFIVRPHTSIMNRVAWLLSVLCFLQWRCVTLHWSGNKVVLAAGIRWLINQSHLRWLLKRHELFHRLGLIHI